MIIWRSVDDPGSIERHNQKAQSKAERKLVGSVGMRSIKRSEKFLQNSSVELSDQAVGWIEQHRTVLDKWNPRIEWNKK